VCRCERGSGGCVGVWVWVCVCGGCVGGGVGGVCVIAGKIGFAINRGGNPKSRNKCLIN
jgi:hypothetical protein